MQIQWGHLVAEEQGPAAAHLGHGPHCKKLSITGGSSKSPQECGDSLPVHVGARPWPQQEVVELNLNPHFPERASAGLVDSAGHAEEGTAGVTAYAHTGDSEAKPGSSNKEVAPERGRAHTRRPACPGSHVQRASLEDH